MAIIGLSKPYIAPYSNTGSTVTYSTPILIGKAVNMSLSLNSGDSNVLYADNAPAESDNQFSGGTLTLTTDDLSADAMMSIFGAKEESISASGVYFVSSQSTKVDLGVLGTTGLVVAGDNPAVRSIVVPSKAIQPQESADGYIVLSDIELLNSVNLSQFILQQTEGKGGFANFGNVVINNCKVNAITGHFFACNNRDMTLGNFVVENSDFLLNITTSGSAVGAYIFNSGAKVSTINNVVFHNNVFQNIASASTLNRFRMINSESSGVGSTVKDVKITIKPS